MANPYFRFKQFTVRQDRSAMKVSTDACLFGAWAAKQLPLSGSPARLLDIGTGTGLLALMLAQQSALLSIDAVELDPAAATQAAENTGASVFHEQIKIFHTDIRTFRAEALYDFIVSNPPFYQHELKSDTLQKNMAHHDEGLLLDELLPVIGRLLAAEGRFYLLWPFKRRKEILQKIPVYGLQISRIIQVKQTTAHSPFRLMIEGKKTAISGPAMESKEMSIKTADELYTKEFADLLKDYYLNL